MLCATPARARSPASPRLIPIPASSESTTSCGRSTRALLPAGRSTSPAAASRRQQANDLRAVSLELACADTRDAAPALAGGWARVRELAQRRVVEDDVGGNAMPPRRLQPPGSQPLEERL